MASREVVLRALDEALQARGFRQRETSGVAGCWVRRTAITNRAVVALDCPLEEDPAPYARAARRVVARAVGFRIPLLYHPGVQVVTLGPPPVTPPVQCVDRIDNQWCVLQAIHVVDIARGQFASAATWGQVISGPDQEAVAKSLRSVLEPLSARDQPP